MTERLVNTINSINVKLSLNKNDKSYLYDKLLLLENRTSKKETKLLEPIIEDKKSLIKIINENLNENDVEKLLDGKIHKYNKYDNNHPMEGVTYDANIKKYKLRFNNITTNSKTKDDILSKINNFEDKNEKSILQNVLKNKFLYQNHYFLIYWHNNKSYFDIQHIISVLNLTKAYVKGKYNEFSHNICYYIWHKNEFNGYILRELIDEETMYSIIIKDQITENIQKNKRLFF